MSKGTFQLHLITDRLGAEAAWLPRVRSGALGGADWVQLRDRSAAAGDLYSAARRLRAELGEGGPRIAINDRLDVALAAAADGVHLAGRSLPVAAARALLPPGILLGRSVHALDEAIEVVREGADYVTFGHVFPSTSKPGLPPRGLHDLSAIVEAVPVPVLAIGGITAANVDEVLATGCAGIAVISAILGAEEPARAAADLRAALDASAARPRHPFPLPRIPSLEEASV